MTKQLTYPRDLIGYGDKPPHPHWPGQARIAVQFVLNYEEGGENSVLHGDEGSEQFLSEIIVVLTVLIVASFIWVAIARLKIKV